jgi:lipopolysaccharide transport system permease protein
MKVTSKQENEMWTKVIRPRSGLVDINLKSLWDHRDLITLFVRRDFVSVYKQTVLGPFWFFLQPLFSTLIFTVIFGKIAHIPTDGLPPALFYMAGIVVWNYFASCLTGTSNTFTSNAGIFGKVYFPRLTVPISVIVTNLATFGIQFVVFLSLLLFFHFKGSAISPGILVLLTPLFLLQMAALGLGLGILISSLTTKYRDLTFFVGFGVQFWMYATPVIYPMSQVPMNWRWLLMLNPMAPIVEAFRFAFLGAGSFQIWQLSLSFAETCVLLFAGIILFSRTEKTFMDTV